jgi:type II secretory pathway pseudopilin PulG
LIELLVVIAIIAVLIAILLPAVQAAREASRRSHCANNLRQQSLAIQSYHDAMKQFPAGGKLHDIAGETGVSWRVLILPYLEQRSLYDEIGPVKNGGATSWTEPQSKMPATFRCPSLDQDGGELQTSSYWGVGGFPKTGETIGTADQYCGLGAKNGIFFPGSETRMSHIEDGTSNTLAVGERVYVFRAWMTGATWSGNPPRKAICGEASNNVLYPINADHAQFGYYIGDNLRPDGTPANLPLNDLFFGSSHPSGAHFSLADSSVRLFADSTDLAILQAMSTIAGYEIIPAEP